MLLLLSARLKGGHKDRADKQRTNHPYWIKRHEFTIGRIGRSGFLIDVNTKSQHECVPFMIPVIHGFGRRCCFVTCISDRMGSWEVLDVPVIQWTGMTMLDPQPLQLALSTNITQHQYRLIPRPLYFSLISRLKVFSLLQRINPDALAG